MGIQNAVEKLAEMMSDFSDQLRDLALEAEQNKDDAIGNEEPYNAPQAADAGGRITDDTEITMRSGDLRKVVDAYRKLSRLAREGKIPTQEERFELHKNIKRVKHLIRKPAH